MAHIVQTLGHARSFPRRRRRHTSPDAQHNGDALGPRMPPLSRAALLQDTSIVRHRRDSEHTRCARSVHGTPDDGYQPPLTIRLQPYTSRYLPIDLPASLRARPDNSILLPPVLQSGHADGPHRRAVGGMPRTSRRDTNASRRGRGCRTPRSGRSAVSARANAHHGIPATCRRSPPRSSRPSRDQGPRARAPGAQHNIAGPGERDGGRDTTRTTIQRKASRKPQSNESLTMRLLPSSAFNTAPVCFRSHDCRLDISPRRGLVSHRLPRR